MNMGQLAILLKSKYLVDLESVNKIQGQAFKVSELMTAIKDVLEDIVGVY